LSRVLNALSNAESLAEDVRDEEQESIDGIPENLKLSDRCISMEEAVDCLDDALESIQEAKSKVDEALNS